MPTAIDSQIQKLRQLRPGWLKPDTPLPDAAELDWFQQQCERYYPDDAPLPAIFPTQDGGISAEWRIGNWAADVEVDLQTHHGLWFASNLRTQQDDEARTLNLDEAADWAWLIHRLAQLPTNQ